MIEDRENIVFTNEGQKIFGVLHLPKKKPPFPCVIFCHGLAGNKTGHYRIYVTLSEMLANDGIASLRFDFRGSGDSEGRFSEMTLSSEVSDALKAIEFVQTDPRIQSNKLGFFGRSLGGAIAIMASAQNSQIKSLGLWAPIFNGEAWGKRWKELLQKNLSEKELMDLCRINGQMPGIAFYQELFQLSLEPYLDKIHQIPLLLVHGEKDEVVPLIHSKKFLDYRNKTEAMTEFLSLPKGDHPFTDALERAEAIVLTTQWFQRTLS